MTKVKLALTVGLSALLTCGLIHGETKQTIDPKQEAPKQAPKIDINKLSEALGNFIGRNLENPGMKFDIESVIKGIREGAAGRPSPMSEEEYEKALTSVQETAFLELSDRNLKAATEFLKENAKKPNIIQLDPEKLQYEVVIAGSGPAVTPTDRPLINYVGKFLDGTVFGNSQDAGGPIAISLEQTIPGFSKLLVGMKEGEKRKLYIHPDLGYGTTGQLPPNSLLIFDVEVVKANSPATEDAFKLPTADTGDDNDDDEESIEEIDVYETNPKK
jgi:peptidylprolyl isomerase